MKYLEFCYRRIADRVQSDHDSQFLLCSCISKGVGEYSGACNKSEKVGCLEVEKPVAYQEDSCHS